MMSELIQKEKFLSFEEICKEWSKTIQDYNGWINLPEEIVNGELHTTNSCIVGEAYNFTQIKLYGSRFDCEECYHYSILFCVNHPKEKTDGFRKFKTEEEFEQVKKEFVKHFNEVHING